jgi:prepilin-type N-terminal cleavage/methylation domain-containing protein
MIETKGPRCYPVQPRRRGSRQGFTLTEIMIALGVLAVGMGMAAGALHAGIQSHIITVDEICRTMIGENAIAIAKARLRTDVSLDDPTWDAQRKEWKLKYRQLSGKEVGQQRLGNSDARYPIGPRSTYGFLALAARARPRPVNDFKIMVVVYEITDTGSTQEENIEVDFKEVLVLSILDHPETGKSRAVVQVVVYPPPPRGVETQLPVGSLMYFPEFDDDPFVEVKSHLNNSTALLSRYVGRRSDVYIPVLTVKIGGQIRPGGLKIRGIYRGRTSFRPAQASTSSG